tara:strand:- start:3308 stop:4252 length:945 start_codon:yes stop_codon:yes gene_type:complete
MLGMALIPLNDSLIKLLSSHYPLAQIVVIRALFCIVVISIIGQGAKKVFLLPRRTVVLFSIRGMCLVIAMYLFFVSLASLPLSTVVSIFFISPLLITLLSSIVLKEKIGIHRVTSVIAALIGVMFVMKPGTSEFHPEMLFALGSAISYAIFQIFTRSLKSDGNLPALIAIQHLCYFFSALPLFAFNWSGGLSSTGNMSFDFLLRATVAPTFMEVIYIAICAGTVLFLSFASSFAYRNVEASLIAPFEYVAIPVSVIWGILIWGDYPSYTAWIGMGLIISSGIYVVYRERLNQVETTSRVPMPGSAGMVQNKKDS